ncbi:MAG: ATP-grasp domain-containing protein [Prevotella sp.]|nr:ATP-grasp domain-containing protein [Prevotella sp.]
MDFSKIRVLVTDGDGKQPLATVRGLKELGCHVTVLCGSKEDTLYYSNKPDEKILNSVMHNKDAATLEFLLSLVSSGHYDVLMPVAEAFTDFVTKNEDALKKYVKLACAPREVYIKASNKQITFDEAMRLGVPCPHTRRSDQDIDDFLKKAKFPIIIKPRTGSGSIGFHKFNSEAEFRERLADQSFELDSYVVQEFVEFEHRIGTLLFIDKKGNVCTSYATDVLRWFPLDAGNALLIKTTDAPELIQCMGDLLKALGWQGFAAACFMIEKKTGQPKLLEINGRIPSSVKLGYMCGFNIARQMLEMVYDEEVTRYPANTQFDKYLRHFDTDIAWFIHSPNRFKTKPSWFSWKNTQEVLFSKDDMKPFLVTLYKKIFSYNARMKKKNHQ